MTDGGRLADRGLDGRSTDIDSGRGIPDWIASSIRHCSRCGAELRYGPIAGEDRDRGNCPACGHIAYVNPRLVVTALPVTDDGHLILIRRGIEPGLGYWAQPGGFLEIDETLNEAAVRETREETGLAIAPGAIVGLYTRLEAAVVVLVFEALVVGGTPTLTSEVLEIRTFGPREVPWADLAFKTTHFAIVDWLARHHPEIVPPTYAGGR